MEKILSLVTVMITISAVSFGEVADTVHVSRLPRNSTFAIERVITVDPTDTYIYFRGGDIVPANRGCASMNLLEASEDERAIQTGTVRVTTKNRAPAPYTQWFNINVASSLLGSFSLCDDTSIRNCEGCGSGTIADLKTHLGRYITVTSAPAVPVSPTSTQP